MLLRIRILNFRSIQNMDLSFEKSNNIIWKNGAWKTNVLQAIACLFQNNISNIKIQDLLKDGENNFYVEWIFRMNDLENKLSFSYDWKNNKKLILLNGKKIPHKVLYENILKISYFSPMSMNLFYLWPKYRREFLDDILKNIFVDYGKLWKNYENIVKNRNKVLKNICEQKSKNEEIFFWNQEFIQSAKKIYSYRIELIEYLKKNIQNIPPLFQNKNLCVDFQYISKVNLQNIESSITDYLEKNFQRDILLANTHIWPHVDDFDIFIEKKNIVHYASRWEMKSIILSLTLFTVEYIQQVTGFYPIILIDDLMSELDTQHINIISEKLSKAQIIFTSIIPLNKDNIKNINV